MSDSESKQGKKDSADCTTSKKRKGWATACEGCRRRKVKCEGDDPCNRCRSSNTKCEVRPREKRRVIKNTRTGGAVPGAGGAVPHVVVGNEENNAEARPGGFLGMDLVLNGAEHFMTGEGSVAMTSAQFPPLPTLLPANSSVELDDTDLRRVGAESLHATPGSFQHAQLDFVQGPTTPSHVRSHPSYNTHAASSAYQATSSHMRARAAQNNVVPYLEVKTADASSVSTPPLVASSPAVDPFPLPFAFPHAHYYENVRGSGRAGAMEDSVGNGCGTPIAASPIRIGVGRSSASLRTQQRLESDETILDVIIQHFCSWELRLFQRGDVTSADRDRFLFFCDHCCDVADNAAGSDVPQSPEPTVSSLPLPALFLKQRVRASLQRMHRGGVLSASNDDFKEERLIFSKLDIGMIVVPYKRRRCWTNKVVMDLLGYTSGDTQLNSLLNIYRLIQKDDFKRFFEELWNTVERGEGLASEPIKVSLRTCDGSLALTAMSIGVKYQSGHATTFPSRIVFAISKAVAS